MISINLYEITLQVLNLLILIYFINKLLAKPLSSFLESRTEKIKKSIEDSEQAKAKGEALISEQKKILKDAQLEAKEIREKASEAALKEKENLKNSAKEEANNLIEKAKQQINQEVKLAKQTLKSKSVETAVMLTEKLINKNIDHNANKTVLDNYTKESKLNG